MIDILFKAKRLDNGEWVEGDYIYNPRDDEHYIASYETDKLSGKLEWVVYTVIPETLGQYTSKKDKHDDKIFSGDVCKVTIYDHWTNKPISESNCLVVFEEFKIGVRHGIKNEVISFDGFKNTEFEVIGNIHNKEINHS